MKSEVYKRKVDKQDELLSRNMDAAVSMKKREDQTQTKNTASSHTSCKMQWRWRWDFRKFIVKSNKFVI